MIKYIPFLTPFIIVLLLPALSGCMARQPDFQRLASAFKFVGCCSVICACIWAYAIVTASNNRNR